MAKLIAIVLIIFSYLNKMELVALKAINFPSEMAGRDKLNTRDPLQPSCIFVLGNRRRRKGHEPKTSKETSLKLPPMELPKAVQP